MDEPGRPTNHPSMSTPHPLFSCCFSMVHKWVGWLICFYAFSSGTVFTLRLIILDLLPVNMASLFSLWSLCSGKGLLPTLLLTPVLKNCRLQKIWLASSESCSYGCNQATNYTISLTVFLVLSFSLSMYHLLNKSINSLARGLLLRERVDISYYSKIGLTMELKNWFLTYTIFTWGFIFDANGILCLFWWPKY